MTKLNKHQFKHGLYQKIRVSKRGQKVFVNRNNCPADRALYYEKITYKQWTANNLFERRYLSYWNRKHQKNILDRSLVGKSISNNTIQEIAVQNKERLEEIQTITGLTKEHYNNLIKISVDYENLGDMRIKYKKFRLYCEALDLIIKHFKM
tara:strand:- start:1572 stop:2024 length:453 start_codon:yes stop_codon:yes gene_type:complete